MLRVARESGYLPAAPQHHCLRGVKTREELVKILESAGFELRNWTSNSREILKGLAREHLLHADFFELGNKSSEKTLGIRWNSSSYTFFIVMEKLRKQILTQNDKTCQ